MSQDPRCTHCGGRRKRQHQHDQDRQQHMRQQSIDRQRPHVEAPKLDKDIKWRHKGVLTSEEAEMTITRTQFHLYHHWDPEELVGKDGLPLMIVYRGWDGRCLHLPVMSRASFDQFGHYHFEGYYVERGGRLFATLSSLLNWQDIFAYIYKDKIDTFIDLDHHHRMWTQSPPSSHVGHSLALTGLVA